jgi:hypothetical protein
VEDFFFATIVTIGTYGPLPLGRAARFINGYSFPAAPYSYSRSKPLGPSLVQAAASAGLLRLRNSCVPHAGFSRIQAHALTSGLSG